ncbi:MAG: DNA modification methylase [Oscillospiraceae bacterium]|jgi:DNA modification methylase|nr:DNA modification methylase [Oscillospiraceae bacterium]
MPFDPKECQMIPAAQLNPAKYNPRRDLKPGDPEYEKLLRSVDEFGLVEPIVWNKRTGNIVGGHQRFKVLRQLGYDMIQCMVVDLDPVREKLLNVALNKIGGEFEMELLRQLVADLQAAEADVTLTGLDPFEVEEMFKQRQPGVVQEDEFDAEAEAEQIEQPKSRAGDVWLLGRHRLLCGDSLDQKQVARLMDGQKARLCFTDPPWNVDYGGADHPSYRRRRILNDKMTQEDFFEFLTDGAKALAAACEPGAMCYLFMSAQEWGSAMSAMQRAGFHWSSTIIWVKDAHVMSRKDYHTRYEPIWYGWLGDAKALCHLADRKQNDVWEIPRPRVSEEHPMMKPVTLAGRAIQNSSRPGDIVLDLFGGSGTTLIACEQTGRTARLSELDPRYADCIVKRYIEWKKSDADVFLLSGGARLSYAEIF